MAIKLYSVEEFSIVDMYTNNLLATLERAVGYPSVQSELSNATWYIDTKGFKAGPFFYLAWMDLLKPFLQQSYKACQGVLSLYRNFGAIRLEKVCSMLEDKHTANYMRLKSMLENNRDLEEQNLTPASFSYMPKNEDVRGADAYQ